MTKFNPPVGVLIFAIFLLFLPVAATANCTGSTPTWTSTPDQSSVASCVSNARSGDTINVSAGSATWSGLVTISNKSVNVIGAGQGKTVITSGGFLLVNSASRISAFSFNWSSNNYTFQVQGSVGFRIDHNTVVYPSASDMMLSYGQGGIPVEGLVDNNTITYGRIIYYGDNNSPGTGGSNRWAEPLNQGTSHYLYIEDNTISWPDGSSGGYLNNIDGNQGCRYVVRFNKILNGRVEAHSLQGESQRGCRAWEIYNNTFTTNSKPAYRPFLIRAGTGVIFHNTSDGGFLNNGVDIDNDRSYETSIGCQVPTFNMCGSTQPSWPSNCNATSGWVKNSAGTSYIDGNTSGQYGYPCRDQIGRSTDGSQWNYTNPAPAQAFQPAYIWRNTQPSGEIPVNIDCDNSGIDCSIETTYHIVLNRDVYTYASSFNGTSGVGEGTLAERPSTCTAGVVYWATDSGNWNQSGNGAGQGQLYVCKTNNTWALQYTPFTYPHPLQADGSANPVPPSGLQAIVQ